MQSKLEHHVNILLLDGFGLAREAILMASLYIDTALWPTRNCYNWLWKLPCGQNILAIWNNIDIILWIFTTDPYLAFLQIKHRPKLWIQTPRYPDLSKFSPPPTISIRILPDHSLRTFKLITESGDWEQSGNGAEVVPRNESADRQGSKSKQGHRYGQGSHICELIFAPVWYPIVYPGDCWWWCRYKKICQNLQQRSTTESKCHVWGGNYMENNILKT